MKDHGCSNCQAAKSIRDLKVGIKVPRYLQTVGAVQGEGTDTVIVGEKAPGVWNTDPALC